MTYRGVIFDFNGTLLWDTGLHNQAWDIFLKKHNISLTDQQKNEIIHGKNNDLILASLFKRNLAEDEVDHFIIEKESLYQEICLQSGIDYAPGVIEFIGFLKTRHIPYAIATASGKENIDFYLKHLRLGSLIDRQYIIFNNNKIKSKPDPEIFQIAMRRLWLKSNEVVIFEDSIAGITAAMQAKVGKVIIVNSMQVNYSQFKLDVITNFDQVNREIFS